MGEKLYETRGLDGLMQDDPSTFSTPASDTRALPNTASLCVCACVMSLRVQTGQEVSLITIATNERSRIVPQLC